MCTVHHRPIAGAPFLLATQHPFFLSFSFEAPYPSKKKIKKIICSIRFVQHKISIPYKIDVFSEKKA
jgi:hypothetical protein